MLTPCMSLQERIAQAKGSRAMIKSKGLMGHPCLTLRCKDKVPEIRPFVLTEETGAL